ncbi:chord-domain-containing protein [Cryphonectria parasitica EP155]|uniref:Chord-domain-containing protein n=1 Tax=Cryphonectria parasitica (strain ATCC 38755 / EP155) TaxID=660469 RepID=A0A9P4Y9Y9_CRYP1|nr:chord-domain-containing protein [Cryphonectria parasitica EP155]KAF3769124.1 chord-domain-containing protein [Cryphonectria parasitica EP155]
MAQKCVHRGCEKTFTDADEVCRYHPGPPVFHEGQKGWKCCKPRVLTFDEFLAIEPCTEGKHSTTDLPPAVEKKEAPSDPAVLKQAATDTSGPAIPRAPINPATPSATPPPPPPESDDDDPALEIPDGRTCRRRACGASYNKGSGRADQENCVHHPGVPIFHEGSKGYTCCKRRVLDFDDFMKIEGCKTKARHLFVGSGKKEKAGPKGAEEELLETVRTDFYQTPTSVIASFFLKKINKDTAKVVFTDSSIQLDLPTTDSPPKRYRTEVPLFGGIDTAKTTFKILGTKLEVTLVKAEVSSWPVLRADDRPTGEILQIGRAGKVVQ